MAKLKIAARNICGSKTAFRLLGKEPKKEDNKQFGDDVGLIIRVVPRGAPDWWTVIDLISQDPRTGATLEIWPGDIYVVDDEVEHDISKLLWTTPSECAHKFQLLEFRWGDHNLLPNLAPDSGLL